MTGPFCKQPIIDSPCGFPTCHRELDPADMLADLGRTRTVITNVHTFRRRETATAAQGSPNL